MDDGTGSSPRSSTGCGRDIDLLGKGGRDEASVRTDKVVKDDPESRATLVGKVFDGLGVHSGNGGSVSFCERLWSDGNPRISTCKADVQLVDVRATGCQIEVCAKGGVFGIDGIGRIRWTNVIEILDVEQITAAAVGDGECGVVICPAGRSINADGGYVREQVKGEATEQNGFVPRLAKSW